MLKKACGIIIGIETIANINNLLWCPLGDLVNRCYPLNLQNLGKQCQMV